jgi:hypothetical protein
MADRVHRLSLTASLVKLSERDVAGAILPEKVIEDNTVEDLKRWIETRGFTVGKKESKCKLLKR